MSDDIKTVSDVVDFNLFKTTKELQEYSQQLSKTNVELQRQNSLLIQENAELKKLLMSAASPEGELLTLPKTKEETLCVIEISRLEETAMKRPLTLEETKKMDLLVKNLYLIKGKLPEQKKAKKINLSEEALLEIASAGGQDGSSDNQ